MAAREKGVLLLAPPSSVALDPDVRQRIALLREQLAGDLAAEPPHVAAPAAGVRAVLVRLGASLSPRRRAFVALAALAAVGTIALVATRLPHRETLPGAVPAAVIPLAAATPLATMPPPPVVTPGAQIAALREALGRASQVVEPAALSDTLPPPAAAPARGTSETAATGWGATATGGEGGWLAERDPFPDRQSPQPGPVVGTPAQPGAALVWPVVGPLTSCFCVYHPLGIDIGVPIGTPVRAIAAGRIAFVGGDACCGYGFYVDIDHGNGIISRYAHLSYIPAIPIGTPVRPGDIIGVSGTTGHSTGPHLHFEIRLHGVPVNPLDVLP